jgi:hypothetical protein
MDFEDDLDALLELGVNGSSIYAFSFCVNLFVVFSQVLFGLLYFLLSERDLEPIAKRNLESELTSTFDSPTAKAKLTLEKKSFRKRPRTSLENLLEETNLKAKQKARQAGEPFRLGQLDENGRPRLATAATDTSNSANNNNSISSSVNARLGSKNRTNGNFSKKLTNTTVAASTAPSKPIPDAAYYSRLLQEIDEEGGGNERGNAVEAMEEEGEDCTTARAAKAWNSNKTDANRALDFGEEDEEEEEEEEEEEGTVSKKSRLARHAPYDAKAGKLYSKTPFDDDCLYGCNSREFYHFSFFIILQFACLCFVFVRCYCISHA